MTQTFGSDPRPQPSDLRAKLFENVQISLHELFHANVRDTQDVVIEGVTFRDCRLEGPAVVLPLGQSRFNACSFGIAADGMRNLILYPASESHISGCIPLLNCVFESVEFFGVAFTGPRAFLDGLLLTPVENRP